MTTLKPSYFNFVVPATNNDYLLYNTKTTGLVRLDGEDGKFIESLFKEDRISPASFPEYESLINELCDKGYFVDHDLDEREQLHRIYSLEKDVYTNDAADINLTIGTTILCNMGCSYCFEFVKPNKTLKDESVMDGVITYLEDMVAKSPVRKWRKLNVCWYGGEPLINKTAIEKLSPKLLSFCEDRDIEYSAEIITNGLLLDEKGWAVLEKYQVRGVQVTIDGPKEIHNKSRPLLGSDKFGNYDRIMNNLSIMPPSIKLTIRVNLDKKIFEKFDVLLQDLQTHGIWPQKFRQVKIDVSWLRTYEEELKKTEVHGRFEVEEFYYALADVKRLKQRRFNEWAEENGFKKAKMKWELPELQPECATWVSPYSMVIDPEGNIHKCWETIHDEKQGVSHISQGFDVKAFDKYSRYDRYRTSHEKCKDCKFIPICDQLSCSHQVVGEKEPPCTYWKYVLEKSHKDQFLFMRDNPDSMVLESRKKVNSGHSNK